MYSRTQKKGAASGAVEEDAWGCRIGLSKGQALEAYANVYTFLVTFLVPFGPPDLQKKNKGHSWNPPISIKFQLNVHVVCAWRVCMCTEQVSEGNTIPRNQRAPIFPCWFENHLVGFGFSRKLFVDNFEFSKEKKIDST
jgi:hypothetical protein